MTYFPHIEDNLQLESIMQIVIISSRTFEENNLKSLILAWGKNRENVEVKFILP